MQGSRGNQSLVIHQQSLILAPAKAKLLTVMQRKEFRRAHADLPQPSR